MALSVSDLIDILKNGFIDDGSHRSDERPDKGHSLIQFPEDYTIIDVETTGLYPGYDEIIEAAAVRVRNNSITEEYQSLVKPINEVDEYITQLTGITNEMLSDAPDLNEVIPKMIKFIGDDILIGHNVNFDINFLYDACESFLSLPVKNDYVDTMRISRRYLAELEHHRLQDIAVFLDVKQDEAHRSLSDCKTTYACYEALKNKISADPGIDNFINSFKRKDKLDLRSITSDNTDFDKTHPLYGKRCVFTGVLEKMQRSDAAQLVANFGGICDNSVTKKTNYLILGNNDYCSTIKDGKSTKQKKAEEYKLKGIDIEIIPENVFYEMVIEE